ncbi:hypothetical protein Thini_2955 [Thiothrix nivea DSM 5205]|uniref:Uncharacterized protein n=1 Tax=Thiothrix nivea (strain ATCC 35100 / DSM 5205 / JP2) TaxID=870187 RepID=A0A656HEF6_THINJ|nr:hypothetical protein Thini_2955 [Thiothrix nivea DSM 5205]
MKQQIVCQKLFTYLSLSYIFMLIKLREITQKRALFHAA